MQVIHISGSPGSGKTTLIEWLAENAPAGVRVETVDTDTLLEASETNTARAIVAIRRAAERRGVTLLVFAGILSPESGVTFVFPRRARVTRRWFIDEPSDVLLARFYGRYAAFRGDAAFWRDIASGRHTIPSSREWLADHCADEDWHAARGYTFLSVRAMQARLRSLLDRPQ